MLNDVLEDLIKSGAGSRGGHIIGKTKSGKPIYQTKNQHTSSGVEYSKEDHKDAANEHDRQSKLAYTRSVDNNFSSDDKAYHHQDYKEHGSKRDMHNRATHEPKQKKTAKRTGAAAAKRKMQAQTAAGNQASWDSTFGRKSMDALGETFDLIKAGEGSRGGKIMGHTASGKPIYGNSASKQHSGFDKQDHADAATHHGEKEAQAGKDIRAVNAGQSESNRRAGVMPNKDIKKIAKLREVRDKHKKHREHHNTKGGHDSGDHQGSMFDHDQKDYDRMDKQGDTGKRSRAWNRTASGERKSELDEVCDLVKAKYTKKIGTGKNAKYIYGSEAEAKGHYHKHLKNKLGYDSQSIKDETGHQKIKLHPDKGGYSVHDKEQGTVGHHRASAGGKGSTYHGYESKHEGDQEANAELKGKKKTWKSEANMKNDLYKSEQSPLLDQGGFTIQVGTGADQSQALRKGFAGNAREMLEGHIQKGDAYGGSLINMSGENFHTDNDKKMQKESSESMEIDSDTALDKKDRNSTPNRKDSLVDASFKSLSQEELFLKSFEVSEEEEMDVNKAINSLVEMRPDSNDPDTIRNVHENSDGVREPKKKEPELEEPQAAKKGCGAKKSELDDVFDIIKAGYDYDKDGKLDAHEEAHKVEGKKWPKVDKLLAEEAAEEKAEKKTKKSFGAFVKSAGPGGMIMDFGVATGNPIADNFTRELNRFSEPVQERTEIDQRAATEKSLMSFVEKGEQKFMSEHNDMGAGDGSQHNGWNDMMNKPMDQQVREAYDAGNLGKGETNPILRSMDQQPQSQPDIIAGQPAPSETTGFVNGEQITAKSETDAAVIEMYNSMMKSQEVQPGEIVAQGGGVSICAGDPMPAELEALKA